MFNLLLQFTKKIILVLISLLVLFSVFFIGGRAMNIPTQFTDDSHYQNTIIKHSRVWLDISIMVLTLKEWTLAVYNIEIKMVLLIAQAWFG